MSRNRRKAWPLESNSPFLQEVSYPSATSRFLGEPARPRLANAPRCMAAIATASLEGAAVSSVIRVGAARRARRGQGARRALPRSHFVWGTAVSSVSPHDECLEQTTPPSHSVGGYADAERWRSSVSDEPRRQDAPREAVGE